MDLHVSIDGRGDRASRIYRALLDAVVDGRLLPGERLPATRELAARLDVSRGTVTAAYERLAGEGFLDSRVGSGTFVSDAVTTAYAGRRAPGGPRLLPRQRWAGSGASAAAPGTAAYDFTVGVPDPGLFPLAVWRRMVSAELRPALLESPTYGGIGHPRLRAAVARHIGLSRSVVAGADDILLTQGAQQALDLIGRVLLDEGDRIAVEDPGYTAAHRLFASQGARVAGVRVDDEGIVVDELPRDARVVYTTPSHQFPLGPPMSLRRRTALLQWASRRKAVIIEDDYDSEFRFEDRPLEPLQSLDRDGRVIYVGSFSKTLLPLLRVGYLVAPRSLQPALHAAKQVTDWQGDVVTQGALARFMDEGLLARHVRRAQRVYAERRAVLAEGLHRDLGDWLTVIPSAAGLHVCALLDATGADDVAIAARAAERGVLVEALSPRFHSRAPQQGLVLGFGAIAAADIPAGLRLLREVLAEPGTGSVGRSAAGD